ncbi:MAG: hypothetical protein K2L25_02890 [Alphaproteobacteria bacterium]|nr:hypothetical protein [Alphaproteobacteria bacterium]
MRHKITMFALTTFITTLATNNADAAIGFCSVTTCTGGEMYTLNTCADGSYTTKCYKTPSGKIFKVFICTSCVRGTLGEATLSELIPECNSLAPVSQCCDACDSASCTGDTTYIAHGAGYESKSTRTCSCLNGCKVTSTSYRCAAGYYGTSTNGTTGCTACPNGGTSVAGSNTSITSCYLPTGTKFSDPSGSGDYTGNCYYTE